MRIPSGKIDQLIYFVALDSADHVTRKTGLSSFTVYRSRNGGTATVYTTPTVTELSSSNMPGVYSLTIDEDTTIGSTSDSEEYCVHITCATMAAVTRTIELYRRDTTSGKTALIDSSGRVDVAAIAGTAQTARDIGASVLLSTGTGTGQLDFTSGVVKANVTQNAGTNITSAAGVQEVKVASIAAGAITAASIAADAITAAKIADGAIDAATFASGALDAVWSTAARTLTAGTNIQLPANGLANVTAWTVAITGNITGNLSGSVGSVTAGVTVTTNNDKTGYSLTQAFPSNFSALGIGAGGHILTVDTLTTYTGNTPQTGDAYARLGAAGAGLTALGDTRIAHLDADVSSRLASGSYTAPDNAGITTIGGYVVSIDAKTTNLPSDPADQSLIIAATNSLAVAIAALPTTSTVMSADIKKVNGVTVNGDGAGTPWGP